jgi:integrase/recombinase XerD
VAFTNGKRLWICLHEKGENFHELLAHHNAEAYLDGYIRAVGIADDNPKGSLFRTVAGKLACMLGTP